MDARSLREGEGEGRSMNMTCPKCGKEVSFYDGDIEIYSIGEKQVTIWHVSIECGGKWNYKRK